MKRRRGPLVVEERLPSDRAQRMVRRIISTRDAVRQGAPIQRGFRPDGSPWDRGADVRVDNLKWRMARHLDAVAALQRYFVGLGMDPEVADGEINYLRRAHDEEEIATRSKLVLWRLWDLETNQGTDTE